MFEAMDVDEIPPNVENNVYLHDEDDDDSEEEDVNVRMEDIHDDSPAKQIIGEYLLYLRGCTRSTYKDVISILAKMQEVVKFYVKANLDIVKDKLQQHDVNLEYYNIDITRMVGDIDCTQGLDTIYKQDSYFQQKFNAIIPRRIQLGENFVHHGAASVDGHQAIKTKKDEIIFIPITEVLPQWIQNPTYNSVLDVKTKRQDSILESFMDGTHFQEHCYKCERPNCKLIKLYYDEIEMCDAIGAKSSSINKLGMFYWMDDDLSPKHQSQLKFINLAAIVSNPHFNTYGMNKVLQHIVDDIKKLERGIDLPNGEKVYGTLSVVIGDNLAVHQLCGFRESFSALHPCRVCKASLTQVRTMCKQDSTLFRTPEEHDLRVQEIEVAEGRDKERLQTDYGINRGSALNEIQGFHVTTSAPPDLTHDDLEGFCILTTKLFLQEICFELHFMTLEELNDKIQNFDYGFSELTAKPSIITATQITDPNKGFKQTAAQMSQLVTMLPLIVVDKVPEEWLPLNNYCKMLEIMVISNAAQIDISVLGYLNGCITEYLQTFKAAYNRNLTPKQHSLVHRVTMILRFGPLGQYTTIRAEAKHQYFKRIAQYLRSYKNLPLTLAKKHQLYQAYILKGNTGRDITTGPMKWNPIDSLNFKTLFPGVRRLQTTTWVTINGKKYVPLKCFLAVGYNNIQNTPEFVALHNIVWRNNSPLFICRKVTVVDHDLTVVAYEVEINEEYLMLSINDLLVPDVFHSHRRNNRQFIIIKKALGIFP